MTLSKSNLYRLLILSEGDTLTGALCFADAPPLRPEIPLTASRLSKSEKGSRFSACFSDLDIPAPFQKLRVMRRARGKKQVVLHLSVAVKISTIKLAGFRRILGNAEKHIPLEHLILTVSRQYCALFW